MANNTASIQITMWGGVNYREHSDALVGRSMGFKEGSLVHLPGPNGLIPLESPTARNFDFERQNIRKRKGHVLFIDLAVAPNILLASDVLVDGIEYVSGVTNARVMIVVSKKTIYIRSAGTWTQINDSTGAAYAHAASVTTCSFAIVDNHLFIGLDGANNIQVYRTGVGLDPSMFNGNLYTNSFGGGTTAINGTWSTAYKTVISFQNRLLMSKGDTIMEYTNTNLPWDRVNGGFDQAKGQIIAAMTQTPDYQNQLAAVLYMFTSVGVEFKTSYDPSATIEVLQGAWPILGAKCVTRNKNWLIYLTIHKTILGVNGNTVIDLGRRLLSRGLLGAEPSAILGPLDNLNTAAPNGVYAYYHELKAQSGFLIPTGTNTAPDTAALLDFSLGEPQTGELQISFETYVRCIHWDNIQHIAAFNTRDFGMLILTAGGQIYQAEQGNADYGTQAINGWWKTPDFNVGLIANDKNWKLHFNREIQTGAWYMQVGYYLNRAVFPIRTYQILQRGSSASVYDTDVYDTGVYSDVQLIKGSDDTDLYAETLAIQFSNANVNETFDLLNVEQRFVVVAEER